jgi:hypothetical protein
MIPIQWGSTRAPVRDWGHFVLARYQPASFEHSSIVKLGWYSSHHLWRSLASAPVDHFYDLVYDCSVDRPRQNVQSRCRADDDVRITIGTCWCLLWLLWRGQE